jgi:uncharacterized membrane protein YGL010W
MKLIMSAIELAIMWIVIPILLFGGAPFSSPVAITVIASVIIAGSLLLSVYSALVVFYWSGRLPTTSFGPETTVQSGLIDLFAIRLTQVSFSSFSAWDSSVAITGECYMSP